MNIGKALVELAVVLVTLVATVGGCILLVAWLLWAVFGPMDE